MSNHLQTYSLYTALDLYLYCSRLVLILLQTYIYTALDQCLYCSRLVPIVLQTIYLYCSRLYIYTALDYISLLLQTIYLYCSRHGVYTALDYMSILLQTSVYTALDWCQYCSRLVSILLQTSVYTALDWCQYCSRLNINTALDMVSILLQTIYLYCSGLYVYSALG